MAKTALKVKAARKPKFAVRGYTRCQRCGRPKAVYRKFGLCRICLREMGPPRRAARDHQVLLVSPTPTTAEGRDAHGAAKPQKRETHA